MTDKKEAVKGWMKDHKEAILVVTVYVTVIGGVVVASIASSKQASKDYDKAVENFKIWLEDMAQWVNEEHAKGNIIYELADGAYLTVPSDAKQEIVLK